MMRRGNKPDKPEEFGSYPPVCTRWEWKPEFTSQYIAIINWLAGIPCICDNRQILPSRGLWLAGNPGTGKSTLMRAIQRYSATYEDYRSSNLPRIMIWRHAKDIVSAFSSEGTAALDKLSHDYETLIIDDLGSEDTATMHFGNSKNVLEEVLSRRYDHNLMTMVTTNMTMDQIKSMYKVRIYDRVREMFNLIYFQGVSHRKKFNPID